ncbi:hypothetical protein ASD78_12280 [Lysobacter sp. Root667]|uniref:hypothetical protein n=1 Tax=Lysobacter sp. Root667 TaxID=1736581 RepID=UPI0006FD25DE|nr:hypothetical protein [Lysobacter sp. Root667]KRA74263.1 hypothetical protein ASD78_12280 [Lysobacter sp. Root667]
MSKKPKSEAETSNTEAATTTTATPAENAPESANTDSSTPAVTDTPPEPEAAVVPAAGQPAPTAFLAAYVDDRDEVTFRGYRFPNGVDVEVSEAVWTKLQDHPCFVVSRGHVHQG